ncbi:MAG: hypothetical protein J3K34DRAFT_464602 [Monoraphidium minutum]|nr:MAG: hypothetical protein J3K34DRAFT_464602 [Monoraphidium minutum]
MWCRCNSTLDDLRSAGGGNAPPGAALRVPFAALACMLRDAAARDVDQLRAYVAVGALYALLDLRNGSTLEQMAQAPGLLQALAAALRRAWPQQLLDPGFVEGTPLGLLIIPLLIGLSATALSGAPAAAVCLLRPPGAGGLAELAHDIREKVLDATLELLNACIQDAEACEGTLEALAGDPGALDTLLRALGSGGATLGFRAQAWMDVDIKVQQAVGYYTQLHVLGMLAGGAAGAGVIELLLTAMDDIACADDAAASALAARAGFVAAVRREAASRGERETPRAAAALLLSRLSAAAPQAQPPAATAAQQQPPPEPPPAQQPAGVPLPGASTPAAAAAARVPVAAPDGTGGAAVGSRDSGSGSNSSIEAPLACAACGRAGWEGGAGKLLLCSGCRAVRYCSNACAKEDWKAGGPKAACARLRAEREAGQRGPQ